MFRIDASSRVPIHEQIKNGLKQLVDRGLLRPGEQVPSARSLAESLVVSPTAVSRAYKELIKEGFLENIRGEGNCISKAIRKSGDTQMDLVQQLVQSIRSCADGGLTWTEIEAIFEFARTRPPGGPTKKDPGSPLLQHLKKFSSSVETPEGVCPYCREKILPSETRSLCLVCGTGHHQDCWNERNHCSVFGCKGTTQIWF
jgi:GntR family transcriptional regulator